MASTTAPAFSGSHLAVAQAVDQWLRKQPDADRDRPPEPWFEFGGGWQGLEVRYRTCCEHDLVFSDRIKRNSHEDQFKQEQQLFGFFTNGLAAIESLFYALYAFGWILNRNTVGAFPLIVGKQEEVNPERTRDAFRKHYGLAEPLVVAFDSVLNDLAWKNWKKIRNVLAHRAVPPRIFHLGAGGTYLSQTRTYQESRLKELGPLDDNTTGIRLLWLEKTLVMLVNTAESFAVSQVPL
jgi:hypothetical protein